MTKKFLIMIIMLIASIFIFSGCAFANIDLGEGYNVPENFSGVLITSSDGTAIQNAVNNIQDGGTIILSGDFKLTKTINIKKNLTLKGLDNSITVLNVQSKDSVIDCEGDITFENLKLTRGLSSRGGAVKIRKGDVKITNCEVCNNFGFASGAIQLFTGTLTLTSCDIHDNNAGLMGGGLFLGAGNVTITDCSIRNNRAGMTGGGISASKSEITMTNCTVTGNGSSFAGTGIKLSESKLTAISYDISNNYLWRSGESVEQILNPDAEIDFDSDSKIELKKEGN